LKAVVNTRYGSPDVLAIREVPKPEPKPGEVLVRVHATTVSRTDCGNLRAQPPLIGRLYMGLLAPKCTILGMDFAGIVEVVGAGVTSFKPGEQVFGMSPDHYGAHADYLCMPATGTIVTMPIGVGFNEAVVCEGAWYADTYLSRFGPKAGDRILIYGASGAIGTAAVQLAKSYGAEVTAVTATRHLELVSSLGADNVVDYTVEDFTQIGETFDFILDAVGKTTYFRCRGLLKPHGIFAATDLGPWWQNLLLAAWSSITGSNKVVLPIPKSSKTFLDSLKGRMEVGGFRAVIDREYPFDAIVDAYRFVETAQKTGIVVINVVPANESTSYMHTRTP
jgi:NADPH:quinone reductase-like Zn-dependent oxidoreductase